MDEEKAKKKYPGYTTNFTKPEQLIDFIIGDIKWQASTVKECGILVKVKTAKK